MSYPNIRSDRSEQVAYDKSDFPAYIRKGILSSFPNFSADSHWHDDIELLCILSGNMQYNVNGKVILLHQGEGIFINARQLHFGYCEEKTECVFLCILLHPILLCASRTAEETCVSPLLLNENIPFYHFKGQTDWERDVLSSIRKIYEIRNDPLSALKIQRSFFDIWIHLCENVISIPEANVVSSHNLSVLKKMISFLHENFSEKVKLVEIARAGGISKTGCCTIFKRYLNKTPNEYLTQLRLRKAIELLITTDMTVLEISDAVGFSGASYFTETFRKFYGCTPSRYRKENAQTAAHLPIRPDSVLE